MHITGNPEPSVKTDKYERLTPPILGQVEVITFNTEK